jgi:hypothetical protein
MDRKLFLSYIQNMQQNNQDMVGFQNSMRKNSWQKPRSIYEMNGGGHVFQGDFDRRDAELTPGRRANKAALGAIKPDLEGLANHAYQEFLDNDGTGHHGIGGPEAVSYLKDHPSWEDLSDSSRDDVVRAFIAHVDAIHDHHRLSQEAHGRDWYADRTMTRGNPNAQ